MLTLDRFQLLAASAQISVVVLANDDVTDIELVPIRPRTFSEDDISIQCAGRNICRFVGTMGLVDGVPHAQIAEPLDERRIAALAHAFAEYCKVMLADRPKDDWLTWMGKLWRLPDTRPEV